MRVCQRFPPPLQKHECAQVLTVMCTRTDFLENSGPGQPGLEVGVCGGVPASVSLQLNAKGACLSLEVAALMCATTR